MTDVTFGAFGKIPSVGDFFRINAPPGFASVWDEWLQRCLVSGAHAYGAGWAALYMSVPIWRFCLTAGVAGQGAIMGVLMPSVDRVGRRFPLTLASPMETPGPAQLDHFAEDGLFARLEDLALDALEDDMTREALETRLGTIAPPDLRGTAALRRANGTLILTQGDAGGVLPNLASGLLDSQFEQPSIWSAVIGGVPRLMVCDGLPTGTTSVGLFELAAPVWSEARPV